MGAMLTLALALLVVQTPQHRLFLQPNLPRASLAYFEAFPLSGTGTSGACSTTAPTGAKGEVLTWSRSGVAECYSNDGQTLTQMADGIPRVSSGSAASSQLGIWREPSALNSMLWGRDWNNAVYTKTNMTCAKTATGMRVDANSASTCTATGANGTALQAIVYASAAANSSFHIKRRTGTGVVEVTRDNGSTWTAITSSLSSTLWRRVVAWDAPGCAGGNCIIVPAMGTTAANPTIGIRIVTSGDAVDLDFAQDEAGTNPTSPILTTNAAAPRGAETGYFTVPAFQARSLSARTQSAGYVPTAFQTVVGAWKDNNNTSVIWCGPGTGSADQLCRCTQYVSGLNDAVGNVYLPASAATFTPVQCDFGDTTGITWTQRGVPAVTASATSSLLVTRIYLGATPLGGASMAGVIKDVCGDPVLGRCAFANYDAQGQPIAAVGDSITLGSAQIPTRWVSGLNRALNRPVYNLGLTGQTAAVCLSDFRTYVLGHGYTSMTVLCGVNSLILGDSGASVYATLKTIYDEGRAAGINVVPATVLPWAGYASSTAGKQTQTDALNTLILGYCTTNGINCADFHASALNDGAGNLAAAYDSGDHIHPNAAGGALMWPIWQAAAP